MPISRTLQHQVRGRASHICEYCHLPDALTALPFQIDHIIAEKHGGPTILENLAYSCLHCNTFKGPNIAGVDQATQEVVRLFHPRKDTWEEHFAWDGSRLLGRTVIGRVTIAVLAINTPYRLAVRLALIAEGVLPTIKVLLLHAGGEHPAPAVPAVREKGQACPIGRPARRAVLARTSGETPRRGRTVGRCHPGRRAEMARL
jgi:hypothetical protein